MPHNIPIAPLVKLQAMQNNCIAIEVVDEGTVSLDKRKHIFWVLFTGKIYGITCYHSL